MPQVQAKRRLVKSPPELWTELSDAAALARHLGEFGEIRITRLEPDSKVVWEGDRANGSVELDSAGWGTQVTLTVEVEGAEAEADRTQGTVPSVREPEPVAVEPEPEPIEPVAVLAGPDPQPAPVSIEPEPEPWKPSAAPQPRRRGFFARLFARGDHVDHVIEAAREVVAVEPPAPTPEPVAIEPAPAAVVVEPEPEPETVEPEPEPEALAPEPEPQTDRAHELLEHVLDQLGQAHHRPFSRA